jgi:CubicO group peptidase (beta-lactamase class C family)
MALRSRVLPLIRNRYQPIANEAIVFSASLVEITLMTTRITCFLLGLAAATASGCATTNQAPANHSDCPTAGHASTGAVAQRFQELVAQGFSGAAVVTFDGKAIFCAAAGEASNGRSFDPFIATDVGSIAKPVTAMAIQSLAREGRLSLHDKLSRWFPQAPEDKAEITIRQMLLHQSGLGEYVPGAKDYSIINEADLARRVLSERLLSRPGEGFGYSNNAYNLLALIVERASGKSYFKYVEESVFRRARINASFDPASFPEVAEGRTSSGWTELRRSAAVQSGPFWGLWGAGGAYMSARDLARLMDTFSQGRILPAARVKLAREPLVPLDDQNAGGLVWGLAKGSGGTWDFYFNGASDHSSADVRGDPDRRVSIAVVSNSKKVHAVRAGRAFYTAFGQGIAAH